MTIPTIDELKGDLAKAYHGIVACCNQDHDYTHDILCHVIEHAMMGNVVDYEGAEELYDFVDEMHRRFGTNE